MAADPTSPPDSGSRFDTSSGDGHAPPHDTPADAFKHLASQLAELRSHIGYFIAAKLDGISISLRNLGIYAALGVVGLIALGGMVVTAVVLVLTGLAGAVSSLFDASPWMGNLIIGILVLALLVGSTLFGLSQITRRSRQKTVDKYERKRNEQRASFGRDVHDRSVGSGHE